MRWQLLPVLQHSIILSTYCHFFVVCNIKCSKTRLTDMLTALTLAVASLGGVPDAVSHTNFALFLINESLSTEFFCVSRNRDSHCAWSDSLNS